MECSLSLLLSGHLAFLFFFNPSSRHVAHLLRWHWHSWAIFFFATYPPISTCLIISLYLEADWFFLFNVWLSKAIQEFGLFLVVLYLAPSLSYVLLLSLLWAYFPSSLINKQFKEWHLLQDCGSLLPSGSSMCPSNHLTMLAAKCCLLSKWDDKSFRKKNLCYVQIYYERFI